MYRCGQNGKFRPQQARESVHTPTLSTTSQDFIKEERDQDAFEEELKVIIGTVGHCFYHGQGRGGVSVPDAGNVLNARHGLSIAAAYSNVSEVDHGDAFPSSSGRPDRSRGVVRRGGARNTDTFTRKAT